MLQRCGAPCKSYFGRWSGKVHVIKNRPKKCQKKSNIEVLIRKHKIKFFGTSSFMETIFASCERNKTEDPSVQAAAPGYKC